MKKYFALLGAAALLLSGCQDQKDNSMNSTASAPAAAVSAAQQDSEGHDSDMHDSGSSLPEGLKTKANPTYPAGTKVILEADHMAGMKGAEATVVGAYDTTAYAVTYTPTTGGEPVKNHKWVIQKEIKDAGSTVLEPGTQVTIEADHMKGMKGAKGVIESAEPTTVYMVDYKPTTGGPEVKNHKWVVESELKAASK
ncbi:YdhK family protein [Paenibacillus physcomitrellae]|uniref:DUF1541 domain-containing protein n=1 Tax=Paenibacillus physcomitrellae TaxID=1619311 RepID=A0ABQ1FUU4_9BACL|nr:YdhK family protein [Paenibacillus physcomitrellae]GGA31457.1 hypothetical protein GCM10010917_15700 [Paenibacillus physcomitrellae]